LLLLVIWRGFLYPNAFPLAEGQKIKIDSAMVMTLTPILLVLIVVAFSLPVLARLKFPGIEAELSQPELKKSLAAGPKSEIATATSPPIISHGPR
jgi:hypothetical protein